MLDGKDITLDVPDTDFPRSHTWCCMWLSCSFASRQVGLQAASYFRQLPVLPHYLLVGMSKCTSVGASDGMRWCAGAAHG